MKKKEPFIEREFCFFYGIVFLAFGIGLYLGKTINAIGNNYLIFMGLGFLGLCLASLRRILP